MELWTSHIKYNVRSMGTIGGTRNNKKAWDTSSVHWTNELPENEPTIEISPTHTAGGSASISFSIKYAVRFLNCKKHIELLIDTRPVMMEHTGTS